MEEAKNVFGILKGHKDTAGKLPLNLVPPRAYQAIALVREFGCKKYGDPWKWLECTTADQYIEAAKRHFLKIELGEEIDPESGLPHLFHAQCSISMAVELYQRAREKVQQLVDKDNNI